MQIPFWNRASAAPAVEKTAERVEPTVTRATNQPANWDDFAADTGKFGPMGVLSHINHLYNPDTFAALRDTSSMFARLPLVVYERDTSGRRRQVVNTPETRLLERPGGAGGSWSRQNFWQFEIRSMETHGRGLALIQRDPRGVPIALHPAIPARWKIKPTVDDRGFASMEYRDPKGNLVDPADILDFVFDFNVERFDAFKAISPVKYSDRLRELFTRGEQKVSDIYDMVSAIFVEIEQADGNEALDFEQKAVALQLAIRLANKKGSGLVPIPKGSRVDQSSVTTAQQNQLAELMSELSVQESKHFGTSPNLHGDSRGSYRNAEAALKAFTQLKIQPLTNVVEQEIDAKLLMPGEWCRFVTRDLTKGDVKTQAQIAVMMVVAGIWTPNEGREFTDMDRYDDEDADKLRDPTDMGGVNMFPEEELPNEEPAGPVNLSLLGS